MERNEEEDRRRERERNEGELRWSETADQKNLAEGGNVPIRRVVGEAARSRRQNTRRGRKRWREGVNGRRGKDELFSARGNPTWRKRKSSCESGTRTASSVRERAGSVEEERENHGAFEKVLSCRCARPLRRYRTPVRCCWPRRGRAASSGTSSK